LVAVTNNARSGDVPSLNVMLRILERRAQMLGLDAPTRSQVDQTVHAGFNIDAAFATAQADRQQRETRVRDMILSRTAPGSAERKLMIELADESQGGWCGVSMEMASGNGQKPA